MGWSHDAVTTEVIEKMHAHDTFVAHAHAGWESRYFPKDMMPLMANPCGPEPWRLVTITFREEFGTENPRITSMTIAIQSGLGPAGKWFRVLPRIHSFGFCQDDDSDDEWSAGLSYGELPYGLETALDATYSKDAGGAFFEWSTGKEFNPSEGFSYPCGTVGTKDRVNGHDN